MKTFHFGQLQCVSLKFFTTSKRAKTRQFRKPAPYTAASIASSAAELWGLQALLLIHLPTLSHISSGSCSVHLSHK